MLKLVYTQMKHVFLFINFCLWVKKISVLMGATN